MATEDIVAMIIGGFVLLVFLIWLTGGGCKTKSEGYVVTSPELTLGGVTPGVTPIYSTLEPDYGKIIPPSNSTEDTSLTKPGPPIVTESHQYDGCSADRWIPGTLYGKAALHSKPTSNGTVDLIVPCSQTPGGEKDVTLTRPEKDVGEQTVFTDRHTRRGIYQLAGLTRASPYGCVYGVDDANIVTGKPPKQCSVTDDGVMNGWCYRGWCLQDNPPSKVDKYSDRFEFRFPYGYEKPATVSN